MFATINDRLLSAYDNRDKDFRRHLQSSLNRIMTSRTDISNNRSTTNKRAKRARGPKRWDLNIYDLHQPISGKQCPQTLTLDFA
ncbi:hypothetical protein BLOT_008914 [Blomia tropicalis]|nr:hypothetical protein BLOT_008914 [Blomia tropicalis]